MMTTLDLNYYRELVKTHYSFSPESAMSKAVLELCAEVERLRGAREGYVLVPVEPTLQMKQRGYAAIIAADKTQVYGEAIAHHGYKAMLAAVPKDKP